MDIVQFIGSDTLEPYKHLVIDPYIVAIHDMKSSGVDVNLLINENVNKQRRIKHGYSREYLYSRGTNRC